MKRALIFWKNSMAAAAVGLAAGPLSAASNIEMWALPWRREALRRRRNSGRSSRSRTGSAQSRSLAARGA